jgi:spermidine/putrescine transport system permease protein
MATQTQERRLAFLATALPPIVWVVAFFLAPLAIVWAYSFGQNVGLTEVDISGTFANYMRALQPLYLGIFVKSVIVAGLTTLLCLIIGFPVALAIVFASERWRPWMLLLIMLPFWTNLLIRTYALIAVLRTEGYVNFTLAWLWDQASWLMTLAGLQPLGDFTPLQLLYNNFAVVVGLVYVHLPFMVLPLYANLEKHDPALLDAAQDLGANAWRRFWRVTFPLSLPGVYAGAALVFIPALGIFAIPDILGGTEGIMIGNVIKQQFLDTRDWPFGSVLSMVLTVMAVGLAGLAAWVARRSRT